MTIMILFLAFTAAHYLPMPTITGSFWADRYNRLFKDKFPWSTQRENVSGFIPWVVILSLLTFLTLWVVKNNLHFWFSIPLETFLLFLALGANDLDEDVNRALHAKPDKRLDVARQHFGLNQHCTFTDSLWPQLVTKEALQRWFTPILWFVILGPVAALVYRLLQHSAVNMDTDAPANRIRILMEWLPAQLMALSLAIVDNFSPVIRHWKGQRCPQTGRINDIECEFLYQAINTAVEDTLKQARDDRETIENDETLARLSMSRQLIWRILFVWMTVLALLILLDIIP